MARALKIHGDVALEKGFHQLILHTEHTHTTKLTNFVTPQTHHPQLVISRLLIVRLKKKYTNKTRWEPGQCVNNFTTPPRAFRA